MDEGEQLVLLSRPLPVLGDVPQFPAARLDGARYRPRRDNLPVASFRLLEYK